MKKVLVIDFEDSFVYNIVEILRQEQINFSVVKAVDISTSISYDFSAIILSPGGKLPQDYPNIISFMDFYFDKVPILGICLGHQLICVYFGAELYHIDKPLHGHSEILTITSISDSIFDSVAQRCNIGLYHSWAIKLSNNSYLKTLAIDSRGVVMCVKHKDLPIYGMQFHPESIISGRDGVQMLRNWINLCKAL